MIMSLQNEATIKSYELSLRVPDSVTDDLTSRRKWLWWRCVLRKDISRENAVLTIKMDSDMKSSNRKLIFAVVGVIALAASSVATAQCTAPDWWPDWLPYYCQMN
ncbi:MAG: hypothetical protein Tsb0027_14790 [Wenzhouxiangellaceae bacterium]